MEVVEKKKRERERQGTGQVLHKCYAKEGLRVGERERKKKTGGETK